MNKPTYIIIHHSAVEESKLFNQLNSINNYHRDARAFPVSSLGLHVGYHSLITGGKNYKCKKDTDDGAHCNQKVGGVSINFQSLGVCVGFNGDVETMSDIHYGLLKKQIWEWQEKYKIPNEKVVFHRHFATYKSCPGSLLDDTWLEKLLTKEPEAPSPVPSPVPSPAPSPVPPVELKKRLGETDLEIITEDVKKIIVPISIILKKVLKKLLLIITKFLKETNNMEQKSTSVKNTLNGVDWNKIGIGASVAVVGALLTYLTPVVTGLNLGEFTPIVVAFWSIFANVIRKYITDYSV